MTLQDQFKTLVGAYYGIEELSEYELQPYILKQIENYIKEFLEVHPIKNYNLKEEAENIKYKLETKRKLQDCLIVLPKIDASMELILLVKKKIREIDE